MVTPKFKFIAQEESANFGRFALEPLEIGFGHTLGTALRRVLYTSLSGSSITSVKIDSVKHQFSTLSGLTEDIVDLILNIKQIKVRYNGDKPATMTLSAKGPGEVKASAIDAGSEIEIANPELVLATLSKEGKLEIEFTVEKGLGYSPAEERKTDVLGVIPVDATFSPVIRVNYSVVSTRVGRVTNFDKLILEVTTNGTISPSQAIKNASSVLVNFFGQIVSPSQELSGEEKVEIPASSNDMMRLTVEELDLPTRIANALRKGGFETVSDLLKTPKKEIAKVKNLGSKSVKIIEAALRDKDIELTD
jgi:DNA-directed RNA polymerase subunit alpha